MKNYNYNKKVNNDCRPTSSNVTDIVQWVYDTHLVEYYVTYHLKADEQDSMVKDYCQEIYLQLCEVDQKKWDELYVQGITALRSFVCYIIKVNNVSDTGIAYRKIKRATKNWISYEQFDDVTSYDEIIEIDRKVQRENYESTEY